MSDQQTIWQIGSGSGLRNFGDVFLEHGVALVGPGDPGRWNADRCSEDFHGAHVRAFAGQVTEGNVVLLRKGRSKLLAIGLVASGYLYLEQFDDVYGWDLQHARRVRWCRLPQVCDFAQPVFGMKPSPFSRSWNPEIAEYVKSFLNSPPTEWQTASLPELPPEEPCLTHLPAPLEGVVGEPQDLAMLSGDTTAFGEYPTEDEFVAHCVVPFFRALGWPPEQMAVKWHRIDIAVFNRLPRTAENCRFVVEAKRIGAGVEGALRQAKRYVRSLGIPRDIVVTDGIRYRLYAADRDFTSVAYANLARLKESASELFARLKRT